MYTYVFITRNCKNNVYLILCGVASIHLNVIVHLAIQVFFDLTELFWEVYSIGSEMDDQKRINYALVDLNVTWDGVGAADEARQGKGLDGFKITAMAQLQVCRKDGCHLGDVDEYYIWHQGGAKTRESKIATTSAVGGWSLREDWETVETSSARGVEWLKLVANSNND